MALSSRELSKTRLQGVLHLHDKDPVCDVGCNQSFRNATEIPQTTHCILLRVARMEAVSDPLITAPYKVNNNFAKDSRISTLKEVSKRHETKEYQ